MNPEQVIQKKLGKDALDLWKKLISQRPQKAQAIVFLQGDRFGRASAALSLYNKQFAPKILITGNNDLFGKGKRDGENNISLDTALEFFLKKGVSKKALIIDYKAFNTEDQAVNTVGRCLKNNWETILLVTSVYHIMRAYLTFVKQALKQKWTGKIIMCPVNIEWTKIPPGKSKTALNILVLEMEKIKRYKNSVATIKEGLKYIK